MTEHTHKLPTVHEPHSYMPSNFKEAMEFCKFLAESDFVPKQYKGKPGDIMACIQFGAERGIPPMQALQNIATINGRPSMFGDLQLAMVWASGLMTYHKEYFKKAENGATVAAVCAVQRKGDASGIHTYEFTVQDAQRAKLLGKPGPWQTDPKRMLMWRARGFALRDKFADALGGLISAEEAMDMPVDEPINTAAEDTYRKANLSPSDWDNDSLSHDSQQNCVNPVDTPQLGGSETATETIVEEDEEGPESGDVATAPLAGGDAPSADKVREIFQACRKPATEKMAIVKRVVPEFSGVDKLSPQERQKVAEALEVS